MWKSIEKADLKQLRCEELSTTFPHLFHIALYKNQQKYLFILFNVENSRLFHIFSTYFSISNVDIS